MTQSASTPFLRAKELSQKYPNDIIALYSMDNKCRWASPSHETILGYNQKEMIGEPWTKFVAPEDHAHADLAGTDAILHGESINFGIKARTKTGSRVSLRGTARILVDQDTQVGYLLFHASEVPT